MNGAKPYCDGWFYRYPEIAGEMQGEAHLFPPGSAHPTVALCDEWSDDTIIPWTVGWGEPDEDNRKNNDVCPTCLRLYVARRDSSEASLRQQALAIVFEELGEVVG